VRQTFRLALLASVLALALAPLLLSFSQQARNTLRDQHPIRGLSATLREQHVDEQKLFKQHRRLLESLSLGEAAPPGSDSAAALQSSQVQALEDAYESWRRSYEEAMRTLLPVAKQDVVAMGHAVAMQHAVAVEHTVAIEAAVAMKQAAGRAAAANEGSRPPPAVGRGRGSWGFFRSQAGTVELANETDAVSVDQEDEEGEEGEEGEEAAASWIDALNAGASQFADSATTSVSNATKMLLQRVENTYASSARWLGGRYTSMLRSTSAASEDADVAAVVSIFRQGCAWITTQSLLDLCASGPGILHGRVIGMALAAGGLGLALGPNLADTLWMSAMGSAAQPFATPFLFWMPGDVAPFVVIGALLFACWLLVECAVFAEDDEEESDDEEE